jgi:hypothetical protein
MIVTRKYQSFGDRYTFERNCAWPPVSDCQASGNASSACVPHQIATKICPEMPRESKGKFRKMGKVHFKEQERIGDCIQEKICMAGKLTRPWFLV